MMNDKSKMVSKAKQRDARFPTYFC